jgi:hypothetical protein
MKSLVVKRSVAIAGHKTSVSLEEAFWKSLKEMAKRQGMTLSALLAARPFGGPKEVLRYLARYTHRVAISNRRLIACDQNGVTFK